MPPKWEQCVSAPSIQLSKASSFPPTGSYAFCQLLLLRYHLAFCCHGPPLQIPTGLILHSAPLCLHFIPFPIFSPSALSFLYCSPAEVSRFMGCLLRCKTLLGVTCLSPVSSSRSTTVRLFPSQPLSHDLKPTVAWCTSVEYGLSQAFNHPFPSVFWQPYYLKKTNKKTAHSLFTHGSTCTYLSAHLHKMSHFLPPPPFPSQEGARRYTREAADRSVRTLNWFPPPLSCDWTVNVAGGEREPEEDRVEKLTFPSSARMHAEQKRGSHADTRQHVPACAIKAGYTVCRKYISCQAY